MNGGFEVDYAERLNTLITETTNPELDEARRVEIVTELSQLSNQVVSELDQVRTERDDYVERLNRSREANHILFSKYNSETFHGGKEKTEEDKKAEQLAKERENLEKVLSKYDNRS